MRMALIVGAVVGVVCGYTQPPDVFRDTVPGIAGFGSAGIPAFGSLSIDLSSECDADGWVNEDSTDSLAMAPVHRTTVTVDWSPEGFPVDASKAAISVVS